MTAANVAIAPRRPFAEALNSPRLTVVVFASLMLLVVAPAVVWPIPRGSDLINHWARLTLHNIAPDDPAYGLYHSHFGLIPNLGVDLLYFALSPVFSAQSAVRVAWALTLALPAFGAFALHRVAFKTPSPTICLLPFLGYNVATTVGLVNFALGMGLAFFGLAFALSRRDWRARDVAALNLIGVALFFCHLLALAAYALMLGLTLATPLRDRPLNLARRAGLTLLALAVPLLMVAFRETAPPNYTLIDTAKTSLLYAPVYSMTPSDQWSVYLLLGLSALALLAGTKVAPRLWLALCGYTLAAMLAPSAWGVASMIDARLKVYVWYLAVAATSLKSAESLRPVVAAAAVAATVARVCWVAPVWVAFQDQAAAARQALAALPLGARVLVVAPYDCADPQVDVLGDLTPFAVIDRRAYVNTLIAPAGLQTISPADKALEGGPTLAMDARWLDADARAKLPARVLAQPWAQGYVDWRRHFSHVVEVHGACAGSVKAPGLAKIGGAAGLDVYRIE